MMMPVCHFTFVQNQRMYNAAGEPGGQPFVGEAVYVWDVWVQGVFGKISVFSANLAALKKKKSLNNFK